MNLIGFAAIIPSVAAFAMVYRFAGKRSLKVRLLVLFISSLLSIPSILFAAYYLHLFPDWKWFFELRSWPGSEFLMIFAGCAGGAAATLLPRLLLVLPLFGIVVLGTAPYLKPVLAPLADDAFENPSPSGVCLQSTPSTCGPASVTTIIRQFGLPADERGVARAAHTYIGGTEAWYLARYVRNRGLTARFDFRETFSVEAGQPAVVGVRVADFGHFIAVISVQNGQVTFADPLHGEERLSLEEFRKRYTFSGFHLVVNRRGF